jgi:hypothetical protein
MLMRFCKTLAAFTVFAILAGSPGTAFAHAGHKTPIETLQVKMEMAKINAIAEERAAESAARHETISVYVTATDGRQANSDCACPSCNGHCHCVPAMLTREVVIEPLPDLASKFFPSDPVYYLEPVGTDHPPKSFA